MHISSYMLILIFSLFSQGFLLSISKSMRKVDDDMILNALNIGKALWNGGKTEKTETTPTLEHYKMEDSSFLDEEDDRNPKFLERRETGDEENSAKFPIGRRDFDSKYVCIFPQKKYFNLEYKKSKMIFFFSAQVYVGKSLSTVLASLKTVGLLSKEALVANLMKLGVTVLLVLLYMYI
ncbi:pro-MCH isoform X2 [Gopherus flavomarginatus]|uniref:pro-MCH isoform X2 n=1 Tax=Gopherus flavomarginatus TaxID=286002 RepID=UPI0021CBCA09|nr:pro-MCH isoform X2 [Gopherus flavomarginatus]